MADRERISFSLSSNSNTGTTPHPHRSKPARVFGNYEVKNDFWNTMQPMLLSLNVETNLPFARRLPTSIQSSLGSNHSPFVDSTTATPFHGQEEGSLGWLWRTALVPASARCKLNVLLVGASWGASGATAASPSSPPSHSHILLTVFLPKFPLSGWRRWDGRQSTIQSTTSTKQQQQRASFVHFYFILCIWRQFKRWWRQ